MAFMNWLRAERDRVAGWSLVALGGIMIFVTWLATSDTVLVSEQIPYLVSGGLGGLFFAAVGAAVLVRADVHDEWRKLDRIDAALGGRPPAEQSEPQAAGTNENGYDRQASTVALATTTPVVLRHEAVSVVPLLIAGALIAVCWLQVSATGRVEQGLDETTLGIGGLLLGAVAAAWYALQLRSAVVRRRAAVLEPFTDLADAEASAEQEEVARDGLWVVEGSRRYHRGNCAVLSGQPATSVSAVRETAGLSPCRLCDAGEV